MRQVEVRECKADIDAVEVYARGAVVRRTLTLPAELPHGPVALVVLGATPWLEPGSLRADAQGERVVTGVRTELEFPRSLEDPGALREELDATLRRRDDLLAERKHLEQARLHLLEAPLAPEWKPRRLAKDPASHFSDARAAIELVDGLTHSMESQWLGVMAALETVQRQCAELEVRWRQATHEETRDAQTPTRRLVISLGEGAGALTAVRVSYTVTRAQWWPAYALRLQDGSRAGSLGVDAFVAQATGEDWEGVRLALCTGDLVDELALPELQSWRLGRRQSRRRPGFRPLPDDLDALFDGYERAVEHDGTFATVGGAAASPQPMAPPAQPMAPPPPAAMPSRGAVAHYDAPVASGAVRAPGAGPAPKARAQRLSASLHDDLAADDAAYESEGMESLERTSSMSLFVAGGAPAPQAYAASTTRSPPPPPEAPADRWLNFDRLVLRDPRAGGRGRLSQRETTFATGPTGNLVAPPRVSDLLRTRGSFDHRWAGEALCDMASDGVARRIGVVQEDVGCRPRLRCVPVEACEVYREIEIDNPFGAPLLAGPIDVFVGGALLRTSPLETVDRGGVIRVGLGQEERVTVVRNMRARESSKGLLGGTTHVVHEAEIELASGLGEAIDVDVFDRVPVSDDKEIEISRVEAEPAAESYDGSQRGQPVRGGLQWTVRLEAGATAMVSFRYAVDLDAKLEIVGGNRRD